MFNILLYIAMSDSINKSLAYLIPQKAQEISNNFAELKEILTQYEEQIFTSLSDIQEYFNSKIWDKLSLIKESIKPYHILKQLYEFRNQIEEEILESKRVNEKIWYFRFQDSHNIIGEILYERWYDYKIKGDNRMKEFDTKEKNIAYKAIRDILQNFIDKYKKLWVEITFSEWWTPGNFIIVNYHLSQEYLNSNKKDISDNESSALVIPQDVEQAKEIPELERENYKIDTEMSVTEKLKNWRTKEIDNNGIVFLRKQLWGNAYVCEYLEWVPSPYIWEQKFNFFAVSQLWLRSKCMRDKYAFKKILENLSKDTLKKQHKLSGRYNPEDNTFEDIWLRNNYRIEDWDVIWISEIFDFFYSDTDPDIAHSVRLVKGR